MRSTISQELKKANHRQLFSSNQVYDLFFKSRPPSISKKTKLKLRRGESRANQRPNHSHYQTEIQHPPI